MQNKVSFRKNQLDINKNFVNSEQGLKEASKLYDQLFSNEDYKNSSTIGITISTNDELNTQPIIENALNQGKEVFVPKNDFQTKKMNFVKYDENNLITDRYGIVEPEEVTSELNPPELLIVPGVAFSGEELSRLGRGQGFFDRYLTKYETNTIALALSKQFYEKAEWPVYMLDVALDQIIAAV